MSKSKIDINKAVSDIDELWSLVTPELESAYKDMILNGKGGVVFDGENITPVSAEEILFKGKPDEEI